MNHADDIGAALTTVPGRFADARWFPVDLHVPRREFGFLDISAEVLDRSTFLDTRIDAPLSEALPVSLDLAAQATLPQAPLAWLFHTSFCGSTLLARVLHLPPHQVVLKEPLVLRRLSDARHAHWPLQGLVAPTVRLLSRPWDGGGAVVVKPTHAALNIAMDLLDSCPASKGVILTSSLDDFLVSNLKKTPETMAKVPALGERALQAGSLHARLPSAAFSPPDLLAAVSLQWAAQRELCSDIVAAAGPGRIQVVDAASLLQDVAGVAWQCAQWMQLSVPKELLTLRADEVAQRNAKAVGTHYDAGRRAAEGRMIRDGNAKQIAATKRWFERTIAPAMRAHALDLQGAPVN